MYKNHLDVSRTAFRIIIKSKTTHRERRHKHERSQIKSTKHTLEQLVLHWGTGRDLLVYTSNLWWVNQSESTTLNESWPSQACSPVNSVDHFRWKELFTRFTLVDSTALINLGDPCKRALSSFPETSFNIHALQGNEICHNLSGRQEWGSSSSLMRMRMVTVHSHLYRVSQEECAKLRESVPYVKVYR